MIKIIIIILFMIYWLLFYISLDWVLERKKSKLSFQLKTNKKLEKLLSFSKIYKEKLPSISEFDKTKIKSKKKEYLKEYDLELAKALLIHTIPFVGLLPFLFININVLIINFVFLLVFNLPFIIIIYYNKVRIQRIIKSVGR